MSLEFLKPLYVFFHPYELVALVKFKLGYCDSVLPKLTQEDNRGDRKKCYEFLNQTSRTFASVIQALEGELRHAVCIFYLVLRALDTVEDDMSIPNSVKIPMLKEFYTYLDDPEWRFMDSTEKDKAVLEEFPVISSEFRALAPVYREVISDICRRMGEGMTVYLDRSPDSFTEWNEYCHYVAGLVGIGLSRLFSGSGLENEQIGQNTELANSMGLFLQKTNIIRDYLEDVQQGREFWPQEAWGKYADELEDLSKPEHRQDAVTCLNELITNALRHIPDVMRYMSSLKNRSVFIFCAIPQVMAVATLERCYNNPNVFTGVVKIRKGEAVRMILDATTMDAVRDIMVNYCNEIKSRIPYIDPNGDTTYEVIEQALDACRQRQQ